MPVWYFDNARSIVDFRRLNSGHSLTSADLVNDNYRVLTYDDVAYVDLTSIHDPDASFTLTFEFSDDNLSDVARGINYVTLGYHVRGRVTTALTVGRAAGDARLVIGTIDVLGTVKGVPEHTAPTLVSGERYRVTLVVDNTLDQDRRACLYVGNAIGTVSPILACTSSSLPSGFFTFPNPRLLIGCSVWTTEQGWGGHFDLAEGMKLWGELEFRTGEAVPPLFYPGGPYAPRHVRFNNLSSSDRERFRVCVTGDLVEIVFETSYPADSDLLRVTIDEIDMVFMSKTEITEDRAEYVYRLLINDDIDEGILEYTVHFSPTITMTVNCDSPMSLETALGTAETTYLSTHLICVRSAPLSMRYEVSYVTDTSITLTVHEIVDTFTANVRGYSPFNGYEFHFVVTPESGSSPSIDSRIDHLVLGAPFVIYGLVDDTSYHVIASVVNLAGETLVDVAPIEGRFVSPIRTMLDVSLPLVEDPEVNDIRSPEGMPGIQLRSRPNDNSSQNNIGFSYYVSVFTEIPSGDHAVAIRDNHAYYDGNIRRVVGDATYVVTDLYYVSEEDPIPIQLDFEYFIFAMVEDFAGNRAFVDGLTHIVRNRFEAIEAEFSTGDSVATNGDRLIVRWRTYYATTADRIDATLLGGFVVPATDDGIHWSATTEIGPYTVSGPATFQVAHGPVSFDESAVSTIYVENRVPRVDMSYLSSIDSIVLTNFEIDDFTIRSNNDPFQMRLRVTNSNTQLEEGYYTTQTLPDQVTFDGLTAGNIFNVDASMSNVFVDGDFESVLTVDTSRSRAIDMDSSFESVAGQMTISIDRLLARKDTMFDAYAVVTDRIVTDARTLADRLIAGLAGAVSLKGLIPDYVHTITFPAFQQYVTDTQAGLTMGTHIDHYQLYVVLVDSGSNDLDVERTDVRFDPRVTHVTLHGYRGTTYIDHVKEDDLMVLRWRTTFLSQASDFTVQIQAQTVVPQSADGLNWRAETALSNDTLSFSILYLEDKQYTQATNAIRADFSIPTFKLRLSNRGSTTITLRLEDLTDDYEGTELFTADIVVTNASSNSVVSETTHYDTLTNMKVRSFVVSGLLDANAYHIDAFVVDPSGNIGSDRLENVRTFDVYPPTITVGDDAVSHVSGDVAVVVRNITVADAHSDFEVYVGLFEHVSGLASQPDVTLATMNFMLERNVAKHHHEQTRLTEVGLYVSAEGGWVSSGMLRYRTNYRYVIMAVDTDGNQAYVEGTVQVNEPPISSFIPEIDMIDDAGLMAYTTCFLTFVEDGVGGVVGADVSGNRASAVVTFSSPPLVAGGHGSTPPLVAGGHVGTNTLDLGAITSLTFAPSVALSPCFTCVFWIRTQITDSFTLLSADANHSVIVVDPSSVTVDVGTARTFHVEIPRDDTWVSIAVTSHGGMLRLYVNAVEATTTSSVRETVAQTIRMLRVDPLTGVYLDAIRVFDAALSVAQIQDMDRATSKQVHLTFDTIPMFENDVTFDQDNRMYVNGLLPETIPRLFEKARYTFHQHDASNRDRPIVVRDTNGEELSEPTVVYILDHKVVNASTYVAAFDRSVFRKVEIRPIACTEIRLFEHTFTIIDDVSSIVNHAKMLATIPIDTSVVPEHVHDAPIRDLAIRFDPSLDQHITLSGETFARMEQKALTFAAWVRIPYRAQSSRTPILYRENAFEMGVNEDAQLYLDTRVNRARVFVRSLESAEFVHENIVQLRNLRVAPLDKPCYVHVFASVDEIFHKEDIFTAVKRHKNTADVVHVRSGAEAFNIVQLDIRYAINAQNEVILIKELISMHVYVVVVTKEDAFDIGDENEVRQYQVHRSNNVVVNLNEIVWPSSNNPHIEIGRLSLATRSAIERLWLFAIRPSTMPETTKRLQITTGFANDLLSYYVDNVLNDTIVLHVGDTVVLEVSAPMHALRILDSTRTVLTDTIEQGLLTWSPLLPGVYRYESATHASMGGTITVHERVRIDKERILTLAQSFDGAAANAPANVVFSYPHTIQADSMSTIRDVPPLERAFKAYDTLSENQVTPNENDPLTLCVVTRDDESNYHVHTHRDAYAKLTKDRMLMYTVKGESDRYFAIDIYSHSIRLAHHTLAYAGWHGFQLDYVMDFSRVGTVYEYEFAPISTSSDTYFALVLYDLRDQEVSPITPHGHGWVANTHVRRTNFDQPAGWPTWHNGTANQSTSSSAYWPRYHRVTAIPPTPIVINGPMIEDKLVRPNDSFEEANELLFEFFADPERTTLVASGTGSQLRSFVHRSSLLHRSNRLYPSVMYYQNRSDTPNGIEFGNLIRVR
jgi:hypothetical protein